LLEHIEKSMVNGKGNSSLKCYNCTLNNSIDFELEFV
jgi:hypothetical protein